MIANTSSDSSLFHPSMKAMCDAAQALLEHHGERNMLVTCGEGTPQLKCTTSSSDGQDERARHLFKPYSLGGQDVPVSLCKPTTHPNHEFEHDRDSRRSLGVESDQSISCEFSRTISVPLPPASLVDSWLKPPPSEAPERLTVRSPSPAPAASGSLANRSTATRVLAAAPAQAAAIILQGTRRIHDVARLVSQMFSRQRSDIFSFAAGDAQTPQRRLKLQSCWPASWRKKLTGLPRCRQQLSRAEAAKIMHAAVLSQGGATIADVTLDLGRSGIMVLQGTSNTELCNVVIEGGILLCHGAQAHLTLTDCTLKGCKLILAEGASVDIHHTTVQEHLGTSDAALVVSGRGTTVRITHSAVSVGRGFVVQDRACVTGTGVSISGSNGTLITASDPDTELSLDRSEFHFRRDPAVVAVTARMLFHGVAVASSDAATVTLRDCALKDFFRGVHALRHGIMYLATCRFETSRGDGEGVYAQMGAVIMKETRLIGCGKYGICVGGGGPTTAAHLDAERCSVERCGQTIVVQKNDWSSANIRECHLNGRRVTWSI